MNRIGQIVLMGLAFVQCGDVKDYAQDESFQLATPQLSVDSVFFLSKSTMQVRFDEEGAVVRYALAGDILDDQASEIKDEMVFEHSQDVRLKAYHPAYLESEEEEISVFKLNTNHSSIGVQLEQQPNEPYLGNGVKSLRDLKKGTTDFRSGNEWLGFQTDSVVLTLSMDEKVEINSVVISCLSDPNSWIFAPESIALYQSGKRVSKELIATEQQDSTPRFRYFQVPIEELRDSSFQIVVYPLNSLPEWHPGAGLQSWFFMDEVVIQ